MNSSPFDERSSGVLLHPSSLPGPHGSGDLGPHAHRFAEFLARSGQRWWQMLPVGPLGGGDSPYDSPSSSAGNPWLVSLQLLARDGLLEQHEIAAPRRLLEVERCHWPAARRFRTPRLERAFERFLPRSRADLAHELGAFRERTQHWLPGFTLFRALKRAHAGRPWTEWEPALSLREPAAIERAQRELSAQIGFEEFVQFAFHRQWEELHRHCRELGVRLLGDVPMFVAHDGADVWEHRDIFQLDERGQRRVVAGVPPDYFSAEGQRWGNPIYDWQALERRGFDWWLARLGTTLQRFDAVRLDHFIGFHRYWEIPAWAPTAKEGRFVPVQGRELFSKLRNQLGGLPFIAEDLGLVTEEVHALCRDFHMPGMRVLEFAFGEGFRDYQPHRFPRECVVYTGTHDNDTLLGWLTAHERASDAGEQARLRSERARALAYAGSDGTDAHWAFIRLAQASVANTAIYPVQDLLGQGSDARMNVPGTGSGNWTYRYPAERLTPAVSEQLRELSETYERIPGDLAQRRA
jgi:4-alpha-glucanotransferase